MVKSVRKLFVLFLVALIVLTNYLPILGNSKVFAEGPTWTLVDFTPYTLGDGTPIFDPGGDEHPIDVDITSGVDRGIGYLPSTYVASDGTNFYVRMRLKGDPYDRKGGFLSSVWLVQLAVGGQHTATIGLNGKSPHEDYVYVANADGTNVKKVYITDSSGSNVPGARSYADDNGHYFLDFQVPISEITTISDGVIQADTEVQLFFGSSKAANLSVINKEWMNTDGNDVDFTGLKEIQLNNPVLTPELPVPAPTITIDESPTTYDSNVITITGTTSLTSGKVSFEVNGTTIGETATIGGDGTWILNLSSIIPNQNGSYILTAIASDNGMTAKTSKEIIISIPGQDLITIDGGAVAVISQLPHTLTGKFAGQSPQNYRIRVFQDGIQLTDEADNSSAVPNTWKYTLSSLVENQQVLIEVKWTTTNGDTVHASTSQKLTYISSNSTNKPLSVAISSITGNAQPSISGTSSGAETVEVQIEDKTIEIVNPDPNTGDWSIAELEKPLPQGPNKIVAIAKNAEGNVVTASQTHDVTVTSITIDNGPAVTLNDNLPTIRGNTNAPDGSNVNVSIGDWSDTTTALGGRWMVEVPDGSPIPDGTHTVTAETINSASATQQLTIDSNTSVEITSPVDGATMEETKPVITGTAELGARVDLQIKKTGYAKAIDLPTSEGSWSHTPTEALEPGEYTITATAYDSNGNEDKATSTFTITVGSVSIASVENVTKTVPYGTSIEDAKAALGTEVTVALDVYGETAQVPITWNEDPGQPYNGNVANSYTFTGTFGTMPDGVDNENNIQPPTGTVTVQEQGTASIVSAPDVTKTVPYGTSIVDAKAALGSEVTVTLDVYGETAQVPITWNEDQEQPYNGNVADSYTFTGAFGPFPTGIDNANNIEAPTGTVTVQEGQSDVTLTLKANPSALIGDGISTSTLKVDLSDVQGNPIPNVEVQFNTTAGTLSSETATTDVNGNATVILTSKKIENLEPITNIVTAKVADVAKGVFAEKQLEIHFAPPLITGQILDAEGNPIVDAKVWIEINGEKIEVSTDENGNYAITVPRGGEYTVYIETTQIIDGRTVTTVYTQTAKVEATGEAEQFKSEKKVSGQLLVGTRDNSVLSIDEVFPNSRLLVHVLNDPDNKITATIDETGKYELKGFEAGKTYQVVFNVEMDGKLLAGKLTEITVGEDGQLVIQNELIDPFGIITDTETGELLAGVDMKLYWADTELNINSGRTPDTLVELPVLENFHPNENRNPQTTLEEGENTDKIGNYAWMVFANGDYYIVAEKDGYTVYDSRNDDATDTALGDSYIRNGIIHIGQTIMRYDFAMEKISPVTITGSANGEGTLTVANGIPGATITLKDKDGSVIGTGIVEEDGTFVFENVPAGKDYIVIQTSNGISSNPSNKADVAPKKPVTLEGKVDDAAGTVEVSNLIPGATVTLKDSDGNVVATGTADSEGNFTFTNLEKGVDYSVIQTVDGIDSPSLNLRLLTDEEVVDDTLRNLNIGYKKEGDTWESITSNIYLIRLDKHETNVVWSSSNDEVVIIPDENCTTNGENGCSLEAQVERQSVDTSVIVTATVSKGNISKTRTFLLIVKASTINKSIDEDGGRNITVNDSNVTIPVIRIDVTDTVNTNANATIDKIILSDSVAEDIVESAASNGNVATIPVPEDPGNVADEFAIEIPRTAVTKISTNHNVPLKVQTDYAHLTISAEELNDMSSNNLDLFFRLVPIKEETKKQQVKNTVVNEQVVKAENKVATPLGTPIKIEANYSGYLTSLFLPFAKSGITLPTENRTEFLNSLAIFIQHSDGDKVLKKVSDNDVTIINDNNGDPVGLSIDITKFSTFTVLQLTAPAPVQTGGGSGGSGGNSSSSGDTQEEEEIVPDEIPVTGTHDAYIIGYPDHTFKPSKYITRAEMGALLSRVYNGDNVNNTIITFPDVRKTHWAKEEIQKAQHTGLMEGYPDNTFRPEHSISRAEMAAIVARWLKLEGEASTETSDVKGHWAEHVIGLVEQANLMKGMPDGTFRPNQALTRAEAVTIINRILDRGPLHEVPKQTWSDVPEDHWAYHDIEEASTDHGYTILDGMEKFKK